MLFLWRKIACGNSVCKVGLGRLQDASLLHVSGIPYHILWSASKSRSRSKFLHRLRFYGSGSSKSVDFEKEENLTDHNLPHSTSKFQLTRRPAWPGREGGAKLQVVSSTVTGSEPATLPMRRLKFHAMRHEPEPILCTASLSVWMFWFLHHKPLKSLASSMRSGLDCCPASNMARSSVPTTSSFSGHCSLSSPSPKVFL